MLVLAHGHWGVTHCMCVLQENVMKQDNVSAGQTRELDNPQLICEWHS